MAVNLTRPTHKIAIQLHLVAESCTICSSHSRRPVRKLLSTPSYGVITQTTTVTAYWFPSSHKQSKVKVTLFLTSHHAMETYSRSVGIVPRILNIDIRWRWVVSFTPRSLYPGERAPGTHRIGGWMNPKANLDAVAKRKIPASRRESNPGRPSRSLVTILT
jgi:hypothetical protein